MPIFLIASVNYILSSAANAACTLEVNPLSGLFSKAALAVLVVSGEITLLVLLYYWQVLQKNGIESGY